jgi:predicted small metal-binding protein
MLERFRLYRDFRKLKKKSFKCADIVVKEFKSGNTTGEHWDKFYESLRDIDNYMKMKIRQNKLNYIKRKIDKNEKNQK